MTITGNDFLKIKGDIFAIGVNILWKFNVMTEDGEETIEKSGLFDIMSSYSRELQTITNARTLLDTYYNPYSKISFSDTNTATEFLLSLNRITEMDIVDQNLNISFEFHKSANSFAFDINRKITSGSATIIAEEATRNNLHTIIKNNTLINNEIEIPKCETCNGSKMIPGSTNLFTELDLSTLICGDCYVMANKFFGILANEVAKITDPSVMKEKRSVLLNFVENGKINSFALGDEQLYHYYNAIFVQIEYFSGTMNGETALGHLNDIVTLSREKGFNTLLKYVELFLGVISKTKDEIAHFFRNEEAYQKPIEEIPEPVPDVQTENMPEPQFGIPSPQFGIASPPSEPIDSDPLMPDLGGSLSANDLEDMLNSEDVGQIEEELLKAAEMDIDDHSDTAGNSLNIMADALNELLKIESDFDPKPISPVDMIKAASVVIEEPKEEEKSKSKELKFRSSFGSDLSDLDGIEIGDFSLKSKIEKAGNELDNNVKEGIKALDNFIETTDLKATLPSDEPIKSLGAKPMVKTLPPKMAPPPGASPPPGMAPPPGASPPPGMAPPPGASPPPGMAPPPGASPPPGMAPPPGASPPPGMAPPPGASPSAEANSRSAPISQETSEPEQVAASEPSEIEKIGIMSANSISSLPSLSAFTNNVAPDSSKKKKKKKKK